MALAWPEKRKIIGSKVSRIDGPDKSTGRAKYSYDVNRPGMLHARILRSPIAHGKIKSIDTSAAEKMPGVKAVHVDTKVGQEMLLAGHEILGIAADTEEHAKDAIRAVKIEFDPLDFLVREEDALKADSKKTVITRGKNNLLVARNDSHGEVKVDDAFAKAEAVVEGEYGVATISHQCLEPHGMVAEWDKDGGLTVWCSTQATFYTAAGLAQHFKVPVDQVKCITQYMGGGFGSKFGADKQGEICAHLAKKANAPVKLMLDRAEEVTTAGNRPSAYGKVKIGGTRDGKVTAYQIDCYGTPGTRGGSTVGPLPYVYDFPSTKVKHTAVMLNAGDQRAMRAPGHPQSCVLTDCPLDDFAAKIGMDPMQVRLKNLPPNNEEAVKNDPQSYNALKNTIYVEEMKIAAQLSDWEHKWHAPGQGGDGPIKKGIGMALHTWGGAAARPNDINVTISADGSVLVACSTQDLGTGERTVLPMVTAEVLGLEVRDVKVKMGDSTLGRSTGSGGSTTCPGTSTVALAAATAARDALFEKLAPRLEAKKEDLVAEEGKIIDKANNKRYTWKEACAKLGMDTVKGTGEWKDEFEKNHLSNNGVGGVQVAEVEVDTETGVVRCTKIIAVQDCGLVINKLCCESQVAGGVIMAFNYALFEERIMDKNTGRQVNPDMEFYKLGGIRDIPQVVVHLHDMPARGVIGVGEPPTISTCAAIGNAIFNAIGVRVSHAPYTPERVLAALAKKGANT